MALTPSPNIWRWPGVYEAENRAQDATGSLWAALREACDWHGADVVDVGCGDGFHLPHFALDARSVTGVEPHPPLVHRARARLRGVAGVRVLQAEAERLPLPDASADLVHARTAYFFGPGCEPGLDEASRVLRPGGTIAIIDLDLSAPPYADWVRRDVPHYDPAGVERFFARQGFTLQRVDTQWCFEDRATLEAVLRIEFSPATADLAIGATPGLSVPVRYRLHLRHQT